MKYLILNPPQNVALLLNQNLRLPIDCNLYSNITLFANHALLSLLNSSTSLTMPH